MSNPSSNRVRGELLREWRFSQNWDVTLLAQRVNLSIGQIQQLETGGTSLFYSAAIRENAARKVAAILGADPDSVIRMDDQIPGADASSKVVDDLIELSRQRAIAAQRPSVFLRHPVWLAAGLLFIGALVPASGWLQQKWQNGGAQQFWREAAVAPVVETVKMAQAPAAPAVPSVAVMVPPDGVAISAWPAASASAPDRVVAPVSTDASAAVSVNPLCQSAHAGAAITPARPSKAGDMVYIVAQKMGSVCVVDGAGVRTVLSLKPQEARSVYGAAPWRVNFELPEQAQLYFQGERLRLPDAQLTTVALHEGVRAQ